MPTPRLPERSTSLPQSPRGASTIRRIALSLTATVITVALLVAMAPTDVDARSRMAIGVSGGDDPRNIQSVKDFANNLGSIAGTGPLKPATWTIWSTWGKKSTKEFPTKFARQLKNYNVVPIIWWEPMRERRKANGSFDCAYAQHKKIAAGKYNNYIKRWARAAKKHKGLVLVRFAHEINGKYFPWTVGACGNTAKQYKASWKKVYNLVRNKVGAKNVRFVWTVAKQSCKGGCNPYKRFYPGNKYVQFAGFSSFNWGNHTDHTWKSMNTGVSTIMKHVKKFTRKPIIVAELASNSRGGPASFATDKPDWIRKGYIDVYNKFAQIKGITYLNVDLAHAGHPDWSLDSPAPGAMKAYAEIAKKTKFKGKFKK